MTSFPWDIIGYLFMWLAGGVLVMSPGLWLIVKSVEKDRPVIAVAGLLGALVYIALVGTFCVWFLDNFGS